MEESKFKQRFVLEGQLAKYINNGGVIQKFKGGICIKNPMGHNIQKIVPEVRNWERQVILNFPSSVSNVERGIKRKFLATLIKKAGLRENEVASVLKVKPEEIQRWSKNEKIPLIYYNKLLFLVKEKNLHDSLMREEA